MVVNPCRCMSLQKALRILAIVEIFLSMIPLYQGIRRTTNGYFKNYFEHDVELDSNFWEALISTVLLFLIGIFGIINGVVLFLGANQRSITKCKVWLYVAVVLTIFSVINIIIEFINLREYWGATTQISAVPMFILRIFSGWVVLAFIQEIRRERIESREDKT